MPKNTRQSHNLYIYQHRYNLSLYIKSRKFGSSRDYLATQYDLIDTIKLDNHKTLREALCKTLNNNTSRITSSKDNCDKIDSVLSQHIVASNRGGTNQIVPLFTKIKKFEKVWTESEADLLKGAKQTPISEANKHKQVYPLYLHLVQSADYTRTKLDRRLWLSRDILKTAVSHADFDNRDNVDLHARSKVLAVYMFHSVSEREQALQHIADHEGTWESPRSIGTDHYSLKTLEAIMAEHTGRQEAFNLEDII